MLVLDQGPDHLAVVHVPVALVDVFQLVALGHQLVELELAVQVEAQEHGNVVTRRA
jgi:hypothetical protein